MSDEYIGSYANEDEYQDESSVADDKVTIVSMRLIRFVLAQCESQNTIITRDKLVQNFRELNKEENSKGVTFDKVFMKMNDILSDTFGYNIISIEPKRSNKPGKKQPNKPDNKNPDTDINKTEDSKANKLGSRGTHFILVNAMPYMKYFEQFKMDQSIMLYNETIDQEEYIGDDMDEASKNVLDNRFSSEQIQVQRGLTCLFISIILLSKNNILHQEMIMYLSRFGIPTDGTHIPIVGLSLEELIKILDKQEYIMKLEERSQGDNSGNPNGNAITMYRIGRRTKHEFGVDALIHMIEETMGIQAEDSLRKEIEKTVGDSYK